MKKIHLLACLFFLLSAHLSSQTTYNDNTGDIDPGIATGNGTLDIVKMEVSQTATDFIFKLTVNGNVSTTDWGKFMVGIATGNTAGTKTSNGWGRPIYMDATESAGMNYFIASWLDVGGGAQLWAYNNTSSSWTGPASLAAFSINANAQSTITYTVSYASLGISEPGTVFFDAYSSGGGGSDSAVDALANPNVSISSWGQTYTSAVSTNIVSHSFGSLPVELTSFSAKVDAGKVELLWKTATEVNNFGFEVERKTVSNEQSTKNSWGKVGFVEGNGTTNAAKEYSFTDNVFLSGSYLYRLKQIDRDGKFTYSQSVEMNLSGTPAVFALEQNYPNPFNPSTVISYQIPMNSHVTLTVYDAIGREVASLVNEMQEAGRYTASFDGSKLSSGNYFAKLQSGEKVQLKKMLMLK